MPRALEASRDFLARSVAAVRSGLNTYTEDLGKPGLDITVEPFDAMNASTPAGFIKLGTSIARAQRARANKDYVQQDVELEREKQRAEIARIRAQERYYLGEGRGTGTEIPRIEGQVGPYKPGTPLRDVTADQAERRIEQSRATAGAASRRSGRISAAEKGLRHLDATIERDTQDRVALQFTKWLPWFRMAQTPGHPRQAEALTLIGIDPTEYTRVAGVNDPVGAPGAPSFAQKQQMLEAARQRVLQGLTRKNRMAVSHYFKGKRADYQDVIDEAALGTGDGEDPNDPMGLDPLGLFAE